MQKNKTVYKEYNQVIDNNNQLSLEALEKIIPPTDSVRLLSQIME